MVVVVVVVVVVVAVVVVVVEKVIALVVAQILTPRSPNTHNQFCDSILLYIYHVVTCIQELIRLPKEAVPMLNVPLETATLTLAQTRALTFLIPHKGPPHYLRSPTSQKHRSTTARTVMVFPNSPRARGLALISNPSHQTS